MCSFCLQSSQVSNCPLNTFSKIFFENYNRELTYVKFYLPNCFVHLKVDFMLKTSETKKPSSSIENPEHVELKTATLKKLMMKRLLMTKKKFVYSFNNMAII